MKRNAKSHSSLLFNNLFSAMKNVPLSSLIKTLLLLCSSISSSLLKMAPFYDMCVAYYQLVKAEDEILYPGYHVHLLDDASETYIYETREGLLKGLEFQEDYLDLLVKNLVTVESQLSEIGLEPSQVLKVCVTTVLFLVIIHFVAKIYLSPIFVHPCYLIYYVICGDSWRRRRRDWSIWRDWWLKGLLISCIQLLMKKSRGGTRLKSSLVFEKTRKFVGVFMYCVMYVFYVFCCSFDLVVLCILKELNMSEYV